MLSFHSFFSSDFSFLKFIIIFKRKQYFKFNFSFKNIFHSTKMMSYSLSQLSTCNFKIDLI